MSLLRYLEKEAAKQSSKNVPTNPSLWSQAISEAKKRFTVYPSAYANGWAAKWYKERGGDWEKEKQAEAVAKKDVGHGGLDEWFSGHGKDKGRAQWGDWVSISPIRKQLKSGRIVEPGDIVGQCGISDSPDWRQYTKGGQDPLKCMPRKKAMAMSKEQRAVLARGKARAERSSGNTGAPVMTRTFSKSAAIFPDAPPKDDLPAESGYSYDPKLEFPAGAKLTPAAQKMLEYRTVLARMGRPSSINLQGYLNAKYEKVPGGAKEVVRQAAAAGAPISWGNLNRSVPINQRPSSGANLPSSMLGGQYEYRPEVPGVPEGISYEYRSRITPTLLAHEIGHALNMHLSSEQPTRPTLPSKAYDKQWASRGFNRDLFRHDVDPTESQAEYFSPAKGAIANERGFVPYNRDQAKSELMNWAGKPQYTPVPGPANEKTFSDSAVSPRHWNESINADPFPSYSPLWWPSGGKGKNSDTPRFINMLNRYPDMFRQTL